MTAALQQQVFALDAWYNAQRASQSPSFRTQYIRRRSQLLRETNRTSDEWKQYLKTRSILLQHKYGNINPEGSSTNLSLKTISETDVSTSKTHVVPTKQAEASRALVGDNSIAENYAFAGVHHIFDQHSQAVTMIKFANNDRSKLCCSSLDGNLSICDVMNEPQVKALLKGHFNGVTGFDWSANNDLVVSTSLDCTLRVWNANTFNCIRTVRDPNNAELLCCLFQPLNNNLLLIGNSRGELRIANVSLGRFMKNLCRIGGRVLCLALDTSGKICWAGNDKGEIISVFCELNGALCKCNKILISFGCSVTSLSYRAWVNREARDPLLLVNATNNSLSLFSAVDCEGGLEFRRMFQNRHKKHSVKSIFCPIMSFREGSCVVTGSEDGSVYFVDVEKTGNKSILNSLQGHASTVLGLSFNYNESLLATGDAQGLIIIWKKDNVL